MRMSRHRFHMRSRLGWPLGALACAATFFVSAGANAQLGSSNVPMPNVLLLLDTSGSFEYMIDGKLPEAPGENGTCCVGGAVGCGATNGFPGTTESVPNRWGVAVQALTGNIQPYYSCASM